MFLPMSLFASLSCVLFVLFLAVGPSLIREFNRHGSALCLCLCLCVLAALNLSKSQQFAANLNILGKSWQILANPTSPSKSSQVQQNTSKS